MSNIGNDRPAQRGQTDLTLGRWNTVGVNMVSMVDPKAERFPYLVREDRSDGRHWIHVKAEAAVAKGGAIEVILSVRPSKLHGLRVRLDLGGKAVKNGTVTFSNNNGRVDGFDHLDVASGEKGIVHIKATCQAAVDLNYVTLGLMFEHSPDKYDYPGTDAQITLESVVIRAVIKTMSIAKPNADSSFHSRHTPYGRTAHKLCRGRGLEIGALHRPFDLDAQVTYLDYDKTASLRQAYRNDERVGDIRQVQIVWKGNTYPFIDDNAFDFVINSHVLEHVCNPGRVIEEWLRVISPGGILYMVVPDKDHTFDRPRALTTVLHLMEEFNSKLAIIPVDHYEDYIRNREGGRSGEGVEAFIQDAHSKQTSIHVHTFTAKSLRHFLEVLQPVIKFEIAHFEPQGMHIHVALKKLHG